MFSHYYYAKTLDRSCSDKILISGVPNLSNLHLCNRGGTHSLKTQRIKQNSYRILALEKYCIRF